jgi:hypothetical protein
MMTPMQPLTHHEIMSLVAPFARAGRHVDLAASDRLQRRLAFKPLQHAAVEADGTCALPALREELLLDAPSAGQHRLTRVLHLPGGAQASLSCEGEDLAALLAAVQAVPPQRQLLPIDGVLLALSHRLVLPSGSLQLTRAEGQVAGLRLQLAVSRVSGIAGELTLAAPAGQDYELPEDLLAVLGLAWSRLSRRAGEWQASIVLRGDDAQRTRDAEDKLGRTVRHLARTLAEPPAHFHQRFRRQRWGVTLRRATPLLAAVALIVAALLVPQLELGSDSVLRMLIFNSPPLLLVWLFSMREMPRIEVPPLPRVSSLPGWQRPADPAPPARGAPPR